MKTKFAVVVAALGIVLAGTRGVGAGASCIFRRVRCQQAA